MKAIESKNREHITFVDYDYTMSFTDKYENDVYLIIDRSGNQVASININKINASIIINHLKVVFQL